MALHIHASFGGSLAKPLLVTSIIGTCLLLVSCDEDPELVAKRDRQQAQIRTLESQLIVLRDKINSAPEDRSEELAELKEVVARDEKSIAELRTSIALLKQQATELKEELDAYKAKYPLR